MYTHTQSYDNPLTARPCWLASDSTLHSIVSRMFDGNQEEQRLELCRPYSRCNSSYCPHCTRIRAEAHSNQIRFAAEQTPENRRLVLATLKGAGCVLENLREYSLTLTQTTRKILKSLGIGDYTLKLETAEDECEGFDYLPHVHVLADTPAMGRSCIPASRWEDAWLSELPAWLHPVQGGSQVENVRSIPAACTYITKSPFSTIAKRMCAQAAHQTERHVRRVLDGICATKGLQKLNTRGRFTSQ